MGRLLLSFLCFHLVLLSEAALVEGAGRPAGAAELQGSSTSPLLADEASDVHIAWGPLQTGLARKVPH